jgi:hypothetical protein
MDVWPTGIPFEAGRWAMKKEATEASREFCEMTFCLLLFAKPGQASKYQIRLSRDLLRKRKLTELDFQNSVFRQRK